MITRVCTEVVLQALGIGRKALAAMMADSDKAGLVRPWFEVGSGRHKIWKWDPDRVDAWVTEVDAWRRTVSEERSTSSAGETLTGSSGRAPSRTSKRRKSSRETQKEPQGWVDVGNLKTLTPSQR